jgi:hypothetical protein
MELIYLDGRSRFNGVHPPVRSHQELDYTPFLETHEAVRFAQLQSTRGVPPMVPEMPDIMFLYQHASRERLQTDVRTAPMLILNELTDHNDNFDERELLDRKLGRCYFPFAKLVYVVKNLRKNVPRITKTKAGVFTFDLEEINPPPFFLPDSLTPYGPEPGVREIDNLPEYIQLLTASSATSQELLLHASHLSDDEDQTIISQVKATVLSKQHEYHSQLDPEYKDNAYVYPHQTNTVEKLGKEMMSRAVVLDMFVGGQFVDTTDLQGKLEHIVEWILNYSDLYNRKRIEVLNELRGGEYTLFPSLNGIVDEYASGPMAYTTTTTEEKKE